MGGRISSFMNALYDSKRREFLGRDGARWGKLGIFYFFFYLGLGGFFCAMLAVFMALSPRDRPRYYSESSRMTTRSNPLSPGLGFRPQPDVEKNTIIVRNDLDGDDSVGYTRSLDQYLAAFYSDGSGDGKENDDDSDDDDDNSGTDSAAPVRKFSISDRGDCTSENKYGLAKRKPCVLVKMNKIVGFEPKPGAHPDDKAQYIALNCHKPNAVAIHCQGEYPADVDNIGDITYFSESGRDNRCGYLDIGRFPYEGKVNRKDVYQAPYIWVQFNNAKPNVLINVMCRVFAQNIEFDKKAGRALTRFQVFIEKPTTRDSSRKAGAV